VWASTDYAGTWAIITAQLNGFADRFALRQAMAHLRLRNETESPFYAPFSVRAALGSGVIGGLLFALVHIGLLRVVRGVPPLVPIHMVAAILLGRGALSPPDTFDVVVLLAAVLLHGTLSIVYAVFLALVLPAVNTFWTFVVDGVYGLMLYYINFYGLDAFSPWFVEERDTVSLLSHFLFGAVVGSGYRVIHLHWYGARDADPAPAHDEKS
jgi:hypothetical protein